jgi:hypothetical protein
MAVRLCPDVGINTLVCPVRVPASAASMISPHEAAKNAQRQFIDLSVTVGETG